MLPLGKEGWVWTCHAFCLFLLKNGMRYEFFKETVSYHIKGHNCKTSYHPRFQPCQRSQSHGKRQSCFWEILCPGTNLPTSSFPFTPAHPSSRSSEEEWWRTAMQSPVIMNWAWRALNYGPDWSSCSDACLLSSIDLEIKNGTVCFSCTNGRPLTLACSGGNRMINADLSFPPWPASQGRKCT